jgi:hypothetical protein
MHANFVLCLLSSSSSSSSDHHQHSTRTCLQSCGVCLRRFFRRLCFFLVLCIWSLSFTATIPLLYTIDSNEKAPKPVYCPGTTQISYLEEWFDNNRLVQSVIFNLTPLLITLFLSIIALLKLFYDSLIYVFFRLKMSKCSPYRLKSSHQQNDEQNVAMPNSISMLSSLGIISNSNVPSGFSLAPITESSTPTSDRTMSSTAIHLPSCGRWCSTSFLRFLLVLSCCLLACIYPIAMRFYLVYFSVLVPLIFAVLNYSLGQLLVPTQASINNAITTTAMEEQQQQQQHHHQQQQQQPLITSSLAPVPTLAPSSPPPATINSNSRRMTTSTSINCTDSANRKFHSRRTSSKSERDCFHEQFEMQSSLMNTMMPDHDGLYEREEFLLSPSNSSQSSTVPIGQATSHQRTSLTGKQKYFSNNLYENYHRNLFMQ